MADDRRRDRPLRDKVAVITGASRGIGLAVARALAQAGCDLALGARQISSLADENWTRRDGGGRVLAAPCNVRERRSVEEFFSRVRAEYGRIDILINNAGIAHPLAAVQDLDPERWMEVVETNLSGTFLCTHFALPIMPDGASIVNNLSVAARGNFGGLSGYNSSKWGALGFTNTLREELRSRRIRVIALLPGPTDTDIWLQFMPEAAHSPAMMAPEAVAEAVLNCLLLPAGAVVEELRLRPISGTI